jgi:hypothetical protein
MQGLLVWLSLRWRAAGRREPENQAPVRRA